MKYIAMLSILVLALSGCRVQGDGPSRTIGFSTVDVYEDKVRGVVCYISDEYKSGGISCLPSQWLNEETSEWND